MTKRWATGILLVAALWGTPGQAGPIVHRTREDGANAVQIGRQSLTFNELMDRRDADPQRFRREMPRFGRALAMGEDALLERRALNPTRFDHYHPLLGWLLADTSPDPIGPAGDSTPLIAPPLVLAAEIPPSRIITPPGDGGGDDSSLRIAAVPEPSTLALAAIGGVGVLVYRRRRKRA